MGINLRAAIVGGDRRYSVPGAAVAAGLAVFILLLSFSPLSIGIYHELLLVPVGIGLAVWWAYRNSGLGVSLMLVLGPVLARLTYWEVYHSMLRSEVGEPVALPLSFGGHGAWEMWIPFSLLLGVLAFEAGVLSRWGLQFVRGNANSVA
jgi:hypothetical protein